MNYQKKSKIILRHFKRMMIGACLASIIFIIGCNNSKRSSQTNNVFENQDWYNSKVWLGGLNLTPHSTVNQNAFINQYKKNNKYWDMAFNYMRTTDLLTKPPGQYVIDSGNVIATIAEIAPKDKDDIQWEAHRNFNDLQYIIKGKAEMGIASKKDAGSVTSVAYDPKTDNENFSVANPAYYDAEPGTFFIFTPNEIHRPAIKVAGEDSIKKIVIKVRVPE